MTAPSSVAMQVRDLTVEVVETGAAILKGVSFELHAGKIFALVGESGSGKSVTSLAAMRLLPNALAITGGSVQVAGEDLFELSEADMQTVRGRRVAMIFQNAMSALNPVQTAGEQVAETLRLHTTLGGDALRQRVVQLFAEVGIQDPAQRYTFYPHQLSGGQQQRVMIAMALACEPDILIADEPTTSLDVTIQEQVLALIRGLTRSRQLAVLLITHDMGVVRNTADEVAVMYQGEIIERAPVEEFFRNPREAYSRRLIAALPDLTHFQAGCEGDALLQLDNVKVHFPIRKGVLQRVVAYTRAVDGVSLSIGRGETYALVGESGSGKSTLGRAILNLERISAGQITFQGAPIHALRRRAMLPYRKKIQVVFQNPYSSMNPRLTVGEIISEGMDSLGMGLSAVQRDAAHQCVITARAVGERIQPAPFTRVIRWPIAAYRYRPGAGGGARVDNLRRAHQRAGCIDPGRGTGAVAGTAAGIWRVLPVYHPRPVDCAEPGAPGGRNAGRQTGGAGQCRADPYATAASLYSRAAALGAQGVLNAAQN